MRLKDRVIVITGAAGAGIGRACARRFAEEGAKLVLSDAHEKRTLAAAEEVAREFGVEAVGVVCNVRERAQVDALMAEAMSRFGRIDGLVNNAGINVLSSCIDMTDEQWNLVLDVCLRGTFHCVRAALPHMIAGGRGGAIVSLSSTAGLEGSPQQSHYSAAKAGIVAFSKAVAREVAEHGVRLNCIAPGLIMNPHLERIYPPERLEVMLQRAPLRRRGEPRDIANAALFLLCDEGSYLTGQTLCLSGGHVMIP